MKRVFLFLVTNLAVVLVLGIVLNIVFAAFGIDNRSITGLLVFSAVFGFGGALISLAMSKWIAKRSTGAQVIDNPTTPTERWLINMVSAQAKKAGIGMPEVAIYDSPEINAFATGMNKNNALVAVSSGLLNGMSEDEAEAVLAHEVSHIANGDMVTLTLIQGVVNTFVIFLARVIAGAISNAARGSNNGSSALGGFAYYGIVFVLEMLFGILASIIVMWFSRQREYRADAGSAKLVGRQKMIAALTRLKSNSESQLDGTMMAFGISGKSAFSELFMSHPPLDKRIDVLRRRAKAQ
ncbi:protease HtpX [Alteromonas sp. KS69]|jgi:heat shock protein HtpX|uniref:Protease HtpX n=1 Tax=Alteromonas naphthalenivorans TaxID=715451 RepID=F5ZF69_ALTNA|nr:MULTISPECIES: protease HtpX [Alteromonas]AEF04846.1 heat shock protein HtpX [Alteromonas naphthalenivorans]RUP81476.1 protease HtpX [Alteromonas sp. KS69]|tara:strand:+ start:1291 stop:2175 length:885 start_codon:yes stop_codon:yes gene_type:complete